MAEVSKFTPNSFFFTDPGALSQSSAQTFGPESEDVYRLTSKFSFSADTNAYAVCTGVVLVQPQTNNAGLVNLILKPFKQPITGFNIKYFVYRGLNIGDFFDGVNVIPTSDDASDFINKINASFTAYYSATGTTPPTFLSSFIGFDPANQPATTLISDLFFKVTGDTETPQTAFELPLIAAGASLGTFASGECGLDIVLDYGDYKLPTPNDQFVFDLNYARTDEAKIDITNISGDFQQQLLKEQIFQFLDVAAFYGFHVANGTVNLNNDGVTTTKTGEDIYNSVIQNFNTKNSLYLYIQSDRTRSYNFYGNYSISDSDDNCLLAGFSDDALSERDYETNGWPVIILTTTQSISDASLVLYLQFVTDNNDNTVLYGQVGQLLNAQGNNFSGPDDLQQDADDSGNQPNLTKVFHLSNPAVGNDGSKNYIATFNILIYEGTLYNYVSGQSSDQGDDTSSIMSQPVYIDDFFEFNSFMPILQDSGSTGYQIMAIQRLKLINHFYNNIQYGQSAEQTIIINDILITNTPDTPQVNRVIYLSESVDIFSSIISNGGKITANTQTTPSTISSMTSQQTYELPQPFFTQIISFTDDEDAINGLQLYSNDNAIPSKVILGLTKDENDELMALLSSNSLSNARLYFNSLFAGSDNLTSIENITYGKFNIGIVGEDQNGILQLKTVSDDLSVYSLDQKYYFSSGYSKYVTETSSITQLVINLDRSL